MNKKYSILDRYISSNFIHNRKIMIGIIFSIVVTIISLTTILSINSIAKNNIVSSDIGDFQYTLFDVKKDNIDKYNNKEYKIVLSQNIGYADFNSNSIIEKINLVGIDFSNINKYPIKLIKGRYPKNENEIVISLDILESYKGNIDISDKIYLQLFEYNFAENGGNVNQYNFKYGDEKELEKIKLYNREYKIVGIVSLSNEMFGNNFSLGYTAFTKYNENNTDKFNISIESNKKIDINTIENYLNYYPYTHHGVFVRDFNVLFGIGYTIINIVAIILVLVCFKLLIDNFKSIYYKDLRSRYLALFSLGVTPKQIKNMLLKEGIILFGISTIISIIVLFISKFILNLNMLDFDITFSIGGFLFICLALIIIILNTMYNVYKNVINNKYIYQSLKKKNDLSDKFNISVPIFLKNPASKLGYINYKRSKCCFKPLINSIILLISSILVIFTIKTYFEYNYRSNIEEDYNITTSLNTFLLNSKIKETVYNKYLEILEDEDIEKGVIKRYLDKEFKTELKNNRYTVISIGKDQYLEYIKKLNLDYDTAKNGVIWYNKNYSKGSAEEVKKVGDSIVSLDKTFNYKIVKVTDILPFGANYSANNTGLYIISDELIDRYKWYLSELRIYTNKPYEIEQKLKEEKLGFHVNNNQRIYDEAINAITGVSNYINFIMILIFMIGIINTINIVSMIIEMRKNQIISLKIIGANKKLFKGMFFTESIFTILKGIVIGTVIGYVLCNIVHKFIDNSVINNPLVINYNIIFIITVVVLIFLNVLFNIMYKKIKM